VSVIVCGLHCWVWAEGGGNVVDVDVGDVDVDVCDALGEVAIVDW
jgi:hypothetical protein